MFVEKDDTSTQRDWDSELDWSVGTDLEGEEVSDPTRGTSLPSLSQEPRQRGEGP